MAAANKLDAGAVAPIKEEIPMEYVTIPSEDVLGYAHPDVGHNGDTFKAGQTYLVQKPIADEIHRMIKRHAEVSQRLIQSRAHLKSIQEVAGQANSRGVAQN